MKQVILFFTSQVWTVINQMKNVFMCFMFMLDVFEVKAGLYLHSDNCVPHELGSDILQKINWWFTLLLCTSFISCPYLHRTTGDTERKYHLRYYKTGTCIHETDARGHCVKNGLHCAFAHGPHDLRPPVYDIRWHTKQIVASVFPAKLFNQKTHNDMNEPAI